MKRLFVSFCFALAMAPSHAAVPVGKIQALLAKPEILCGRFDQTKHLAGMKKPLLSSGRFCVAAGRGVLWRTLQPFPSTLRLSRDEILQMHGDRVAVRVDARQEPTVRLINNMLFSLLAGDLAQLEKLFEGEGSVQDKQWSVALKARDPGLAKVIAGVSLEGGAFVRQITLHEANGDRTSISFSAMQTGEAAIAPEEAAQF
ncbi:outer membrane lipoprotein carrier protein LolA [Noviherbaspirillum sedimenti]|uniref:Outer membrane lipoprotein carrier protein LolA n=1 Tax=Noviherbaspirillum sedimenti TaxID=2320865 RepID=A0A3A3G4Z1_9BURK|nr:outer membrane lipoprotein carrier protein LolA [Noviherbaspirillum sedimenti]RJG02745.1 outer membrane lipoprotein carrier protein LolA [Noviherbaspirillum sedimenti]